MKLQTRFIFLILVLMIMLQSVFAGTTYNQAVDVADRPGKVYYSGTVTFTDSLNGAIYYTQAMYIGALSDNNAFSNFQCSEAGTEDVNVFVEYAPTPTGPWSAGTTDTDLDAIGTTLVIDTLGVVQGAASQKYKAHNFVRYKFVAGQDMNATVLTWGTNFNKNSGIVDKKVAFVKDTGTF